LNPRCIRAKRNAMKQTLDLFSAVFTTRTLVQIIVVLTAAVLMKWIGNSYDLSWATALVP
jgi:hypothetical protein